MRHQPQQQSQPQPYRRGTSRAALVAGGSGVIGSAISVRLARGGYRVAVGYHTGASRAEEVVRCIVREGGVAVACQGDAGSPEGCARLAASAREALGGVDILVYAAGVEHYGTALDTGPEEWRRVQDVNVGGAFFLAKELLPEMIRRRWGRIVMIGSVWGEVGASGEVAYSAAKAALSGMTKALAKEVARAGVTVNAVAPGVIESPMNARFDESERAELLARIPVGRFGTGDDVAAAVSFLIRDEAAYVTGHVLWVSGGFDPLPG